MHMMPLLLSRAVLWGFFVTAEEHAPMHLETEIKAGSYGS